MPLTNRRTFLTATVFGLLAAPLAAEAQQAGKVYRLGFLETGSTFANLHLRRLFQEHLREFGYIEGQNIAFETRAADGKNERLSRLASELVSLKVDAIVTTGTPAAVAAKEATSSIPPCQHE